MDKKKVTFGNDFQPEGVDPDNPRFVLAKYSPGYRVGPLGARCLNRDEIGKILGLNTQ